MHCRPLADQEERIWFATKEHERAQKNNAAFWRKKLAANQARNRFVTRILRRAGWRVLRIWEHELARKNAGRLIGRIRRCLAAAANCG